MRAIVSHPEMFDSREITPAGGAEAGGGGILLGSIYFLVIGLSAFGPSCHPPNNTLAIFKLSYLDYEADYSGHLIDHI